MPQTGPESIGMRIRRERERQRIGLRELARQVNVSASLISQVELGRASPSVGTLYAIVNALGISLDQLFFESGSSPAAAAPESDSDAPAGANVSPIRSARPREIHASQLAEDGRELVVRSGDRKGIQLSSGVRWERMTAATDHDVEFLYVTYDVGGASCPEDSLIRHAGREYGHVLTGRLGVTVGFDTHELEPGDSISFDSTTPHRLFNDGEEPVKGIWFVVGRGGDARVTSVEDR